ncbi:sulfite exporter TauE/SafE family protein [Myroides pelagicus]|uniref:Probable membrane transporter protein n=1 Tax=Myroides pelagicus TaxID=270914 RepID=A0A7K1GP55_9FLAO|nr:TSUP family transporter [Myroides pelagicus]MEC4113854.1 TSUP family transporter [Myroides pelagicus]MTH30647.1 TSUP family transporter [Myroides pelagicus]
MELDIFFYLCIIAFCAGFIDAIAGGGGLIQTPLSLALLPSYPISTIIGTLKIPAFSGTGIAVLHYLKKSKIDWLFFLFLAIISFISAFLGSYVLTIVSNDFMKPLLLVVLVALWLFTYFKKDFSTSLLSEQSGKKKIVYSVVLSVIVGFYDGFIGPATGTFFIMGFVFLIGMDFYKASSYAKMINLATNFGSICLFLLKGQIIWTIAIPMAISNGLGGYFGAKMAILKGIVWVRYIFLLIMLIAIGRFAYEVLFSQY